MRLPAAVARSLTLRSTSADVAAVTPLSSHQRTSSEGSGNSCAMSAAPLARSAAAGAEEAFAASGCEGGGS